jgi:hypothetical protein
MRLLFCVCIPLIVARQRLGKSPLIVARQRLCNIPLIVARQRLGRNASAVTNTHATIEELLDASFSMRPVSYQGKSAISSSQNLFACKLWGCYLRNGALLVYVHAESNVVTVFLFILQIYKMTDQLRETGSSSSVSLSRDRSIVPSKLSFSVFGERLSRKSYNVVVFYLLSTSQYSSR